MDKSTLAITALALASLGQGTQPVEPPFLLKEERMVLEYTPAKDEATVFVQAESEASLAKVEVFDPSGARILDVRGVGGKLALSGFSVDSCELGAAALLRTYPEGRYELRALASDGRAGRGRAALVHELLPEPVVVFPVAGATDVEGAGLLVSWVPDPDAAAYRVILEQDDNDGLTVELPAGTDSFQVPRGVLAPGTHTLVEVGAVSRHGNSTLVEIPFTTR